MPKTVEEIMQSDDWNPAWFVGVDEDAWFVVLDGGMPIGVQIIATGSTVFTACRNAIKGKRKEQASEYRIEYDGDLWCVFVDGEHFDSFSSINEAADATAEHAKVPQ